MDNNVKNLTFVTTSKDKYEETKLYLNSHLSYKINLVNIHNINFIEIQGTSEQILINKLKQAAKFIEGPILVEDSAFSVLGMNNMPGPYIKDFFVKLGNKKIYSMFFPFLNKKENEYDAIDKSYLGFYRNIKEIENEELVIMEGNTYGKIVMPNNEEKNEYNWCFFFIPEGEKTPYGSMTIEQKNRISARNRSLKKLCEYLEINKNFFLNL